MAPRKRARPNPNPNPAEANSASLPPTNPSTDSQATSPPTPTPARDTPTPANHASGSPSMPEQSSNSQQVQKSRSWYGSWPRPPKSAASSPQIVHETIHGGTSKPTSTSDLRRFESKKSTETLSPDNISETTLPKITEDSPPTLETTVATKPTESSTQPKPETESSNLSEAKTLEAQTQPSADVTPKPSAETEAGEQPTSPERPTTSSGWLGWLAKSPVPSQKAFSATEHPSTLPAETPKEPPVQSPAPEPQPEPEATTTTMASPKADPEYPSTPRAAEQQPTAVPSGWFGLWGQTTKPVSETEAENLARPAPDKPQDKEPEEDVAMPDAPPPKSPPPTAGSTWAFWSRDIKPKAGDEGPRPSRSGSGEIAVMGQGSEAKPEPAPEMEVSEPSPVEAPIESKPKLKSSGGILGRKNKRLRPESMDLDGLPAQSGASTPQGVASSKSSIAESTHTESQIKVGNASKQASAAESTTKILPPNLLLPSFNTTYQMKENPSIIKQIAQLLLRTQQPLANHVYKVKDTPKVKKAIAIGVHGLFPASFLRPMIGQPTGTSIRLANQCAESIRRWVDANGCPDCEIEKVALEGEGKIGDRVDNLWKLLLNWIEHIRDADLIIVACHSQGVPVATMLLAKLIDLGIVTNARIGVCAMDYKSGMGMLMGTAAELWEFSNPESEMSKRYETALKKALEHGVRMTFIGSIDDQLVPMESAIYSPASHPYIYRAVFIDGRIHAPDFIAHLVGFALKLRNLGVSDHGLVRELSTPLAGSLYSGEGHSRLYWDDQVYDLAVSHALETTDVPLHIGHGHCQIQHRHVARPEGAASNAAAGLANPNPYHLPWIMRGLLEEDFVKTELSSETEELLRQFDAWKPTTKALKDVKYRLEAVRSKL